MEALSLAEYRRAFAGAVLGGAVGDAVGLPREGMSGRRGARIFGPPPLRHGLVFGRGMGSDDAEHACMTLQALLASRGEPDAFARSLAWRLRGWLIALPAGVGSATARAIIKLWLGLGPRRSGVFSAGNGPAMRAAVIGVYAADDPERMSRLIHAATVITHSDPAAEHGALVVAIAAAVATRSPRDVAPAFLAEVRSRLASTAILPLIESAASDAAENLPIEQYLAKRNLDRGITGYINHTVPAAIFLWLRSPTDYRRAVESAVIAGGDTDSVAAIVGALVAITGGIESIPADWSLGVVEWPRTRQWMTRLANAAAGQVHAGRTTGGAIPLFWPGLLIRNVVFLGIVVTHALRRLLPPY